MNHSPAHLLQICKTLKTLKSIHAHLIINGSINSSDIVLNKIIRLYSRFRSTDYAHNLFDRIPQPNAFLWTSLIHGFVEDENRRAFSLFCRMLRESVSPLGFTITAMFKSLRGEGRLKEGEMVYGFVMKCGLDLDVMVQNAVIDLFMRWGEVCLAKLVFDETDDKDVVSWNSMISGYCNNGQIDLARELFDRMIDRNLISWTSIICGYAKAGEMGEARVLFDAMPVKDLAVWNVMVSGYVDVGDLNSAIALFEKMPSADAGTWNLMILGSCKAGKLDYARDYFDRMPKRNVASWTMMIDGYMKFGNVTDARILFNQMPEKNMISWSTMIGGYAKNGEPHSALELLEFFMKLGLQPDETFILGVISACSQLGILHVAESVINDYVGPSLFSNIRLVTSLIDMYAKCGRIEKARQVFEESSHKDLLCYSTMIAALANHGLSQEAISLFEDMRRANIRPDAVTLVGVLTACNHRGLINEGRRYFVQMTEEFGIQPTAKHYACMVDLLGRAGCLREAHCLIIQMPIAPTSVVWGALLAACTLHRNVQLAEIAASELFKIEPNNSGNYILLLNIYAGAKQWQGVARLREIIRKNQVKKNRGSSWIELESGVYEFVMGDLSDLESDRIYHTLELLSNEMKLFGKDEAASYGILKQSYLNL